MKITEGKAEGLKREFKAVIAAKDFEAAVDKKIVQLSKGVKLPGFRPGKVPLAMLKQKYRASALSEALDEAINAAVGDIVKKHGLKPAILPDVKMDAFEDGKDVSFSVVVENLPEIEVKDISKLELVKQMAEVPAEEVEKTLANLAKYRRETVKIEDAKHTAATGDIAVIDFVGSVGGVEFKGGRGEAYPLELGSNAFIPGFEDQLVGLAAGEKAEVKVKFPKDYHAKDLAGKDAVFAVEIKELRGKKEAVVDEAFAKSLGAESLEKVREDISARIKSDYEQASRMKLKKALLDALDAAYGFASPEGLVEAEYKGIIGQYEHAKAHGHLDEREKEMPEADLFAEYKRLAVRRVKLGLLLSEIGKEAKVTVTPDDLNKAIMAEARRYPGQERAVFEHFLKNKEAVESLKAPIYEEKIVDYILSKAKLNETVVSVEELFKFDEDAPAPAAKGKEKKEPKEKAAKKK